MGDDLGLGKIVALIEAQFQQVKIHGIVMAACVGQGRIDLGSKIASTVMKSAVFKQDKNTLKRVIVCGTKADKEDPEDVEEWRHSVGDKFKGVLGGEPGYKVTTGVKKTAKNRASATDNNSELLNAIKQIQNSNARAMGYEEQDAEMLGNVIKDTCGLDDIDVSVFARIISTFREKIRQFGAAIGICDY